MSKLFHDRNRRDLNSRADLEEYKNAPVPRAASEDKDQRITAASVIEELTALDNKLGSNVLTDKLRQQLNQDPTAVTEVKDIIDTLTLSNNLTAEYLQSELEAMNIMREIKARKQPAPPGGPRV